MIHTPDEAEVEHSLKNSIKSEVFLSTLELVAKVCKDRLPAKWRFFLTFCISLTSPFCAYHLQLLDSGRFHVIEWDAPLFIGNSEPTRYEDLLQAEVKLLAKISRASTSFRRIMTFHLSISVAPIRE